MAIRIIYKKLNLIMSYYHFLKKLCSDLSLSSINCIYLVGCFFIIIVSSIFTKSLLIFVMYTFVVTPLLLSFQIKVSFSSRKISLFRKKHAVPLLKEDLIGFIGFWFAQLLLHRYMIFFFLMSLYKTANWDLAIVVNLFLTILAFFILLPEVRVHITRKYGGHALRLLGYNATIKAILIIVEAAVPPLIIGGFGLALHGSVKTKAAEKLAEIEAAKALSLAKIQSETAIDVAKINGDSLVSIEVQKGKNELIKINKIGMDKKIEDAKLANIFLKNIEIIGQDKKPKS